MEGDIGSGAKAPAVRQANYDIISGLFICYVLLVHSSQKAGIEDNLLCREFEFWFFFFMPWFYFKAGFFDKSRDGESFLDRAGRLRRLALPYVSWMGVGFAALVAIALWNGSALSRSMFLGPVRMVLWNGSEMGNLPIWFLLSLILVTVFARFAMAFEKWMLVALPLVGWILDRNGVVLPLGLSNLFLGLFFYLCGHRYRRMRWRMDWKILCGLFLPAYLVLNLGVHSELDFRVNHLHEGHYLVYCISSLVGIVLLEWTTRKLPSNALAWVGQNAMVFFAAHWPILLVVQALLQHFVPAFPKVGIAYGSLLFFSAFAVSALLVRLLGRNRFLVG